MRRQYHSRDSGFVPRPATTPPAAEARGLGKLLVVAPAEANPEPGSQVSQVRPGRLHR